MATALSEAIYKCDVELLIKLLDAGEDPNEVWKGFLDFLRTPLFEAVGGLPDNTSKEEVEALLDAIVVLLRHGAIVTDKNEERAMSPLLSAVHHNQIACARILLLPAPIPTSVATRARQRSASVPSTDIRRWRCCSCAAARTSSSGEGPMG